MGKSHFHDVTAIASVLSGPVSERRPESVDCDVSLAHTLENCT